MAGRGVCKFFLQGNCKYGDRCWNHHPKGGVQQNQYGTSGGFTTQNRFSTFTKINNPQQQSSASTTSASSNSEIIKNIATEMDLWNKSKMWPFSCFAHTKELPCLPGFDDFSPEEMRMEAYNESRNHAAQINYKAKEAQLGMEYNAKREKLRNPDATTKHNIINFIEEIKKGTSTSSSSKGQLFSTNSAFGGAASSTGNVFGGAKSSSGFGGSSGSTNLFGKGTSATTNSAGAFGFGNTTTGQNTQQTSAFGATSTQSGLFKPATFGASPAVGSSGTTQTSAFGGLTAGQTGTFGTKPFGTTGQGSVLGSASGVGASGGSQTSAFGGTASSTPSGFGGGASTSVFGTTSQTPAFGASAFGQTAQTGLLGGAKKDNASVFGGATPTTGQASLAQPKGLFGKPATGLFGKPVQETAGASSAGGSAPGGQQIYTSLDKLTPQEKTEFEAAKFTLGRIPTKPPPKEYV